jgi:colanic acid/amylovoran biosynthesis protein
MTNYNSPLFILEGNGTTINRGCEAILWSTLMILDKAFGNCRYINAPTKGEDMDFCSVHRPDLTHLTSSENWATPFAKIWRIFRKKLDPQYIHLAFEPYLKDASAMLVLGGDNISLDYGVPDRQFYAIQHALEASVPVMIWGASIGPFTKRGDLEKTYMEQLRRVPLIGVRETLTQAYLAENSVSENVVLVADSAFVLPSEPVQLPQDLETALCDKAVGINLSPLLAKYQTDTNSWTQKAVAIIHAVDQVLDAPIILVPHVFKPNTNDHAFLAQVANLLGKTRNPIVLVGPNYNSCQLKWIIGRLRLFVGARTHSTIASLSSCVPTISLGYSIKARGINQDIFGHLDWLIPSDMLTPERASDLVYQLNLQAETVRNHLVLTMPQFQERSWNSGELLKTILK